LTEVFWILGKQDSTTTTLTRCRFLHRPPTNTPRSLSASKKL